MFTKTKEAVKEILHRRGYDPALLKEILKELDKDIRGGEIFHSVYDDLEEYVVAFADQE